MSHTLLSCLPCQSSLRATDAAGHMLNWNVNYHMSQRSGETCMQLTCPQCYVTEPDVQAQMLPYKLHTP